MTPDPRQRAWARYLVSQSMLIERIEAALAEADLPSLDWYDLLWTLEGEESGRLRMAHLARKAVVRRYNVTRLADKLEKAGLVERSDCPVDGRGTVCAITAKGRALRARMWSIYRKQIDELFGKHLSAREAETIAAACERMITSLRKNKEKAA
jgi:DNA-binding MarR family transcriptional regulator